MRIATGILLFSVLGACSDGSETTSRMTPAGNPRIRATVYPGTRKLQYAEVVGVSPATRAADGTWSRQCSAGPVDGLVADVSLVGSAAPSCDGPTHDSDRSLRPGDALATVVVVLDVIAAGCADTPTFDEGHTCPAQASTTVFCGPLRHLEARDLVPDPAAWELPSGVTASDIGAWVSQNVAAINAFLDANAAALVVGAESPESPRVDTSTVRLAVDCLDAHAPAGVGTACGGTAAHATLDRVDYRARTATRSVGHNVIALVDQSGSIGGLVDDTNGHRENKTSLVHLAADFRAVASDPNGYRLAAVRRLQADLGAADRFAALAFGEELPGGMDVPCDAASGDSVQARLSACFGTGTDAWSAGIEGLQARVGGRSNLWQAVKVAYDFLRDDGGDAGASNDIIVVTDGPDTCGAGEAMTDCARPCSEVDASQVMAELAADRANPAAKQVRIHFVQFEAAGYPGRDPRQIEVACLSGGTFQFVNANGFNPNNTLANALDVALESVRYLLGGAWQVAVTVPALTSNDGQAGTPPGALYGTSGALTLRAESHLATIDLAYPFGLGSGHAGDGLEIWDRRPTVIKPCSADADCGAGAAGDACTAVCSGETHVCAGGADGVGLPNGATCLGGGGSCCDGTCTSGACGACSGP